MMRIFSGLAAGLVAVTLSISPLSARDLSASDMTALDARIALFDKAIETNDFEAIGSVVPPKLIAAMAEQFGMEPAQLTASMHQAMENAMSQVTVMSYAMDTSSATVSETSAGRPYALIPSTIVMKVDNSTMQGDNKTLAFADEGVWYLVRIDDANQVRFLTLAYPEFKGIDFPAGTLKVIEE